MGSLMLMDYIVDLLPNPMEGNHHKATTQDGETEEFVVSPGGVPTAYVFKTISDQYGKYSLIKVLSGEITSDLSLVNARTGNPEKLGRLYQMCGKKATEVKELTCGDIGAIGKMEKVKTGDTLCDSRKVVALKGIPFAEPCYSKAIAPKTRGQDDKVAAGLAKMNEEDPSFSVVNNPETRQVVLSGAGDMQLDVLVSRLKSRFGVEAELSPARVPYRSRTRSRPTAGTRSRPAAPVSSVTCGSASSRSMSPMRWSLPRKCSAAVCPRTSSPPWKRACGKPPTRACWPGILWSA